MSDILKIEHFVEFSPYHGRDVKKTRYTFTDGTTAIFIEEDVEEDAR